MANNTQAQAPTPAQRNLAFAQMTRHMLQKQPAMSLIENSSSSFILPKTNLTSKIYLLVEGSFKVAHASETTFTTKSYSPYRFLRNVSVSINNGFNPFQISGVGLAIYNKLRLNSKIYDAVSDELAFCRLTNTASSAGAVNYMRFMVELPFVLNERDPIGLILTQNEETVVTCQIDTNAIADMFASATGYTISEVNVAVTPIIESFSIPPVAEAMPDLSILKLVHEQNFAISQTGELTLKLPVGTTYRKIAMHFEHADGTGFTLNEVDNLQMILNQADIPYNVPFKFILSENQKYYGDIFEQGTYIVDLSYQGIPNLGGARDYIDTERLTEFWLKTNAGNTGNAKVIYETLARLRG